MRCCVVRKLCCAVLIRKKSKRINNEEVDEFVHSLHQQSKSPNVELRYVPSPPGWRPHKAARKCDFMFLDCLLELHLVVLSPGTHCSQN